MNLRLHHPACHHEFSFLIVRVVCTTLEICSDVRTTANYLNADGFRCRNEEAGSLWTRVHSVCDRHTLRRQQISAQLRSCPGQQLHHVSISRLVTQITRALYRRRGSAAPSDHLCRGGGSGAVHNDNDASQSYAAPNHRNASFVSWCILAFK